jgi:hypothetical protein
MIPDKREAVLRAFIRTASDELPGDGVIILAFSVDDQCAGVSPLVLAANVPRDAVRQLIANMMAKWDEGKTEEEI